MKKVRYGRITSCALDGITGVLVEIEVCLLPGLPSFDIVGLGDCAVRESKNRVHAAIRNSGYNFPQGRLTASYAPAWLRKQGTGFDLALALAILMASNQLEVKLKDQACPICVLGELSLNGEVKSLPGVICRALACADNGIKRLLVPLDNIEEATSISSVKPIPVLNLKDAAALLAGKTLSNCERPISSDKNLSSTREYQERQKLQILSKLSTISGQKKAIRGITLAAAGWHHSLLLGSPGCGKTTIARLLPALLPELDDARAQTVTMIHSVAGRLKQGEGLVRIRPFEAPHHSTTMATLVGGGINPKPGLCSLAHEGILFLDELTEFPASLLDSLRQPLEKQEIMIARMNYSVKWPANFLFVGAANPCKCGYYLETDLQCRCSSTSVSKHMEKISGPLLDRIDIVMELSRLTVNELSKSTKASSSSQPGLEARKTIERAWQAQAERCLAKGMEPQLNGRVDSSSLSFLFELDEGIQSYAANISDRLGLSVRAYHKVLRLARTIADLEDHEKVLREHIAEALQYRLT